MLKFDSAAVIHNTTGPPSACFKTTLHRAWLHWVRLPLNSHHSVLQQKQAKYRSPQRAAHWDEMIHWQSANEIHNP